jgi:hypothetical protein
VNPGARARDLAIPVTSCAAAGVGTGHLLDGLTRDELTALVNLLALAASADPVRVRVVVAAGDGVTPVLVSREVLLRRGHAEAVRLRAAGRVVPRPVRVLDSEYRESRKRARAA